MQLERIFYCRISLFHYMKENAISQNHMSVSLIDSNKNGTFEIMIFIGESSTPPWKYEVRIYIQKPTTKYKPKKNDNVSYYEQNSNFHTFFFDDFDIAKNFVDNLSQQHSEYRNRPVRFIK